MTPKPPPRAHSLPRPAPAHTNGRPPAPPRFDPIPERPHWYDVVAFVLIVVVSFGLMGLGVWKLVELITR